jgi:tetratricopeptide (TPR) repeat protein
MSNSAFETILKQALHESAQNNSEQALALFQSAIELDPSSPLPHFLMAAEYMELAQLDNAEVAYANTLALHPQFEIARFQLGLLYFSTHRNSMALMTWRPLMELVATHYLRLFSEGLTACLANDLTHAKELLAQGILNNQENPPLNLDMQRMIESLEQTVLIQETTNTHVDTSASTQINTETEPSTDESNHFLLNQYQQGTLH